VTPEQERDCQFTDMTKAPRILAQVGLLREQDRACGVFEESCNGRMRHERLNETMFLNLPSHRV